MAKVKGTAVRASVIYLNDTLGGEGYAKILERLGPEDRETFSNPILQSSWYELSQLIRLMTEAQKDLQLPPGRSVGWEMGRFSADHGLNTIYKVFFKVADPAFIIRKASQVMGSYYDSGRMEAVTQEPHSAHLRLTGFNEPHRLFCDRIMGWMERTMELTGAKSVRMEHPKCMARGDSCCDYLGRWS
jgi:hypothetical protein